MYGHYSQITFSFLELERLHSGVFSESMRNFLLSEPLQLLLIVAQVELITRSACAFLRHWLALGFSRVSPLCRY